MRSKTEIGTKSETKGFKDYKYNSVNPFMEGVIEYITDSRYRQAVGHTYQEVLNEGTGELEKQKVLILGKQKKVDRQEYSKIYKGAINKFFGLSKNTSKLLDYIMDNITYGHDRICILPGDIKEKVNISRAGTYRCILQLLEIDILAKADTEGCYYINPTIMFKGDRITLATQYIVDKGKDELKSGIVNDDGAEYYAENNNE